MKRSLCLVYLLLGIINSGFAQSSVNALEEGSSKLFTLGLLVVIATVVVSYYDNKKFKANNPAYKGKVMWSLIVFPTWFAIGSVSQLISQFLIPVPYLMSDTLKTLLITTSALSVVVYGFLWYKIRGLLLHFSEVCVQPLEKLFLCFYGYMILITVVTLLTTVNDELYMGAEFNSEIGISWASVIFMAILLCFFAERKIRLLAKLEKNVSKGNPGSAVAVSDRLQDLKKLYDAGVINDEEFNSLKKNILKSI